jgi:hypothetical protein
MESPLSFNSSENFRKKLLVRNLPPYKVDNAFSNNSKPGSSEFTINDLTPIDSPSVEQIGNQQEKVLLPINQYGPQNNQGDFGNMVPINNNLNYKSNEGVYGYPDSIGSDLEVIGNNTEKQLIIKNVYRPQNGLADFGSTAWYINNDKVINTIGEGEYTIQDTVGGNLETTANLDRPVLITNNQYGPQLLTNTEVPINNNYQTNPNEGEYGFPDTFGSQLETVGDTDRPVLFAINQYGPDNIPTNEVQINQNLQTNSNEGEYGFPDTVNSELQLIGEDERTPSFLQNPYGPEQGQSVFEVDPYRKLKNLIIPQGNYLDATDTFGSELELEAGIKETEAYIGNTYATGTGEYDPTLFRYLQTKGLQLPYANSDNTFIFLPSTYTPYSILISDNPSGSDGTLSEDSSLAGIGAKQLNKEFKHRVALELYQQTLGQINLFSGNVNPETGEISANPNTDPFNAIGLLTGNVPIIARKYNITTPDFLFGQGINFAAKLAGLYSPYSYIPGEYFDYPNSVGNGPYQNPLSLIGGALGSLFSALQPANQSSSELLVEYTSVATRKLLYDQLRYNIYRPNYKIGNNLLAPPGSFYVGDRKNHLTELVSPAPFLPYGRDGKTSAMGPVLSYSDMGKLYETSQLDDTQFGINSRNLYSAGATRDGVKWIGSNISGGLTWIGSKSPDQLNCPLPGKLVGRGNQEFEDNSEFNFNNLSGFDSTKSTNNNFTPGSILDVTQKLIDAGERSSSREHVGKAINQVSKVFNDGYQEITKGSRVVRYTTKNSTGGGDIKGLEYCRIFTKDRPYYTYDELQKTDGNIRKYTDSVLDNTWNLNIAPVDGYSVKDGKVKKYMFSLENLAWRTSNKKGFTYEDLPACEKGPNGGRIMWFPPYGLSFDEQISTGWNENTFLGRTEPIYTYTNTSRKGNLSFKVIVDHPSILNLIVDRELENVGNNGEITQIVDSFFAGCTKYDLWDLTTKFPMFTPNDVFETQILTTEDIVTVVEEHNYTTIEEEVDIDDDYIPPTETPPCTVYHYEIGVNTDLKYTACTGNEITLSLSGGNKGDICVQRGTTPQIITPDPTNTVTPTGDECTSTTPNPTPTPSPTPTPTPTEPPLKTTFPDIGFYFDNNFPDGTNNREGVTVDKDFKHWYDLYIASENQYVNLGKSGSYSAALNKIVIYGDPTYKDYTNYVTNQLPNDAKIKYLDSFVDTRKDKISEFFGYIKKEFEEAKKFIEKIGPLLDAGDTISFDLVASASAVNDNAYNINLSKRRYDSVKKWIYAQTSPNGTTMEKYVQQGKLKIKESTVGEDTSLVDEPYKFIKCSKDFQDRQKDGTVSVNAMACRRTKISNIERTKNVSQNENPTNTESSNVVTNNGDPSQTNQQLAGQDFIITGPAGQESTGQSITQPNSSSQSFVSQSPESQPYTNSINTRPQDVQTQTFEKRKDLTKRLARKLLTECNYFEYIQQNAPMIYDGIKSKIKYFQPAFHSITPEGLNSRLVFLQQCMRPGDTIPTISESNGGQVKLLYNDVSNSAFGAPPICVLRIGDFFHTKIVIDGLTLKYDEVPFDLNPEGIGVQPMIADVTVSFSFIGGHGLAEPVAKLQNALSFNYYGNTEMYDERAESTSQLDLSQYDAQIISQIKDELNVVDTSATRPTVNDGGVTIGVTKTNTVDLVTSATTGTITYKDIMSKLVDSTKSYVEKTTSTLEKINQEYLIGGLQIFTKDRKYTDGFFNSLGGDLSNTANIFGYASTIQDKLNDLATKTKEDIDNDLCPLLPTVYNQNLTDIQIKKIKKQLKDNIDTRKNEMTNALENYSNEISTNELDLISLIDKISFVSNGHDGFIKKTFSTVVYNLSGTTKVTQPTLPNVVDTLQELVLDSYLVKDDMNTYYQKLSEFSLIPTGDDVYSSNYTQNTYLPENKPGDTRFFMLFGKPIIDNPDKFVDDLINKAIPNANQQDKDDWFLYLMNNVKNPNKGLQNAYLASMVEVNNKIEKFRTEYFNSTFTNYLPYNKDKERLMWYQSQVPANSNDSRDLSNLYKSINSGGDKFNLKKKFK